MNPFNRFTVPVTRCFSDFPSPFQIKLNAAGVKLQLFLFPTIGFGVSGFPNNEFKGFSTLCEAEAYFNKPGSGNCVIGAVADKNLLDENNFNKFSDSAFTEKTTKIKSSTCGNSPLFESTSSKASQYFKTEAEDFSEYLPLESFCNEPSDQERHYMKFSSFLRMCELLHDNLEYARDIADVHKPMFLLFEGRKGFKRDECESESDDDDNGLLHFDSESHLFNYLGLEKAKSSSIVVAERYFHSTYKLEFASASEGNLGKSGAGILLRRPDDSVACGLMVGLGTMPKAVAEFSALIIGLRASLERGIYHIEVSGKFEWIHVCFLTLSLNYIIILKIHVFVFKIGIMAKSQGYLSITVEIKELQNYFSDKYVMDLIKEAEDLMNIFKLFIVKHEVNACISASSLANSAASLPDGCLKKVNENGK